MCVFLFNLIAPTFRGVETLLSGFSRPLPEQQADVLAAKLPRRRQQDTHVRQRLAHRRLQPGDTVLAQVRVQGGCRHVGGGRREGVIMSCVDTCFASRHEARVRHSLAGADARALHEPTDSV